MIYIEERQTQKLPGETSLFLKFNYNKDIVDIIKDGVIPVKNFNKTTTEWEIPLTSLAYLIDKLNVYDEIDIKLLPDTKVEDKQLEQIDISKLKTKPFNYQLDAIQRGLNQNSWLLLDAPGLGKTLTLIYLAQELKEKRGLEHCLIICGINTLKSNWKKEIKLHSDLPCRILGERTNRKGETVFGGTKERLADLKEKRDEFFLITNVETLRDEKIAKELNNGINKIDCIFFDEVHAAKNPSSQQSKGLLKLKDATYKVGATGTAITNSPLDAYMPLKWIGAERSTFSNFKYYYCNYGGPFNNILVGFRNMDVLKDQLEKYSLRRTKDLLDLPPKNIINEYVDMNDTQANFYENIKQGIIDQVDKVHMSTANLLAMVARLRQATACPSILTTENIPSSKIERAIDLAEQIIGSGEKVVIFSTFKDSLPPIMEALKEYKPLLCTGDIPDAEISKNIDLFQKYDENKVIVATWQKLGTGVTLTRASYMIFLDTPWTSAVYLQAQDRIYRIGTKSSVFIYNLICKNTIDERVLEIVDDKEAIADYIVDDKVTNKSMKSLQKYIEEISGTTLNIFN